MAKPVIVLPSFNDWESLRLLLPQIDRVLASVGRRASILVVNDASTEPLPPDWPRSQFDTLDSVEILNLRCNLGHQRAIALGLYHVSEFTDAPAALIMDADGEDRAQDLAALLAEADRALGTEVIFAARTRRMEGLLFRLCYRAYRRIHLLLTGIEVRVGNFSVVPRSALVRLMAVPDLWNNYAAAVYRARLPHRLIPIPRGKRLSGQSKMNFASLLVHGLTSMSVFSDQISARVLLASVGSAIGTAILFGIALGVHFFANLTLPSWVNYVAIALSAFVIQSLTLGVLFAFLIANRRNSINFVLQRDAPYFILNKISVSNADPIKNLSLALSAERSGNFPQVSEEIRK